MSALDIFEYSGIEVRVVVIDDEPWFVASDVARVLGYRMASDLTRSLDDDERGTHETRTPSGDQHVSVINEGGLFKSIVQRQTGRMDNDQARQYVKDFQRWVTHEVLPTIGRTGSYAPPPPPPPVELSRLDILTMAIESEHRAMAAETRVHELEPAAAHAETFRAADGLRTIGDVANDFKTHCAEKFPTVKVLHQDVFAHAARLGIVIRGNTVRHNQPTAQAIEAGWAKPHRSTFDTNSRGPQTSISTRLTPRGEARLWDGLCDWLGAHGTLRIENAA